MGNLLAGQDHVLHTVTLKQVAACPKLCRRRHRDSQAADHAHGILCQVGRHVETLMGAQARVPSARCTSSSTTMYCCQVPLPPSEGHGTATTRWSTWKRLAPAPFSLTTPMPEVIARRDS